MAEKRLKLVNGVPTMVEVFESPYDESIYYSSGLNAETNITLPNSGEFQDEEAQDLLVILNNRVVEVSRDFTVVGASAPYTQIKFVYDLLDDSVVRFKSGL